MKRRKTNHGNHNHRRGRRADKYRAWHKEEVSLSVCPHCRRATWSTRSGAKEGMRTVTARPDFALPVGFATMVYPCPEEHGWHWRVVVESSNETQAS